MGHKISGLRQFYYFASHIRVVQDEGFERIQNLNFSKASDWLIRITCGALIGHVTSGISWGGILGRGIQGRESVAAGTWGSGPRGSRAVTSLGDCHYCHRVEQWNDKGVKTSIVF